MPRAKPWLKMWTEWLDDPKMLRLSLAEQAVWWKLLSLAQRCNADGKLVTGSGSPLALEEIADTIHLKSKDMGVIHSLLAKMQPEGSLYWESNILVITHFTERQSRAASDTPEAMRERQRRHRVRAGQLSFPSQESRDSPFLTPNTTTTTTEGEQSRADGPTVTSRDMKTENQIEALASMSQKKRDTLAKSLDKIDQTARKNASLPGENRPNLAVMSTLFEQEGFGLLTPMVSEKLRDLDENFHGPVEWIKEAFGEAVRCNHRNLAYVSKILETWQKEGRKDARRYQAEAKPRTGVRPEPEGERRRFETIDGS